jgi:membrane protein implicated in regulation of membrane protease activity
MLYKIGIIGGSSILFLLAMGMYFLILSFYTLNLNMLAFGIFCLSIGAGTFALYSRKKTIFFDKVREIFK